MGYEEGERWVTESMITGYPRFFVHKSIQALVAEIIHRFGTSEETATLFPSPRTAAQCYDFFVSRVPPSDVGKVRIVNLAIPPQSVSVDGNSKPAISSRLSCVLYPKEYSSIGKQVWQHTGSGISSRRSEFCLKALKDGYLIEVSRINHEEPKTQRVCKGPRRYQKAESFGHSQKNSVSAPATTTSASEKKEFDQFVEERFGRNLDPSFSNDAKLAVKRRIAGSLTADGELNEALAATLSDSRIAGLTEDDVFLYPNGMNAIYSTHQTLMSTIEPRKSICFGFPYVDTLKILEKWGPGVLFYGHASTEELDDLERRLESGERYLALFTEFPGNPLLKSPDLQRIHGLARKYDFAVVVDESVGNFINVNVLPYADVVVSSLTKIFSGDSNVMGGSAVYNPHGQYYQILKAALKEGYEDNYWAEDAIFLERNSRDFVSRIERINAATESVTEQLKSSPLGKSIARIIYTYIHICMYVCMCGLPCTYANDS